MICIRRRRVLGVICIYRSTKGGKDERNRFVWLKEGEYGMRWFLYLRFPSWQLRATTEVYNDSWSFHCNYHDCIKSANETNYLWQNEVIQYFGGARRVPINTFATKQLQIHNKHTTNTRVSQYYISI